MAEFFDSRSYRFTRRKLSGSSYERERARCERVCGVPGLIPRGLDVRTIERRKKSPAFAAALERGRAKGRVSIRRMLFSLAAKGNVAAAIFLAKNLLGYKDYFSNEHSGPDGGPISVSVVEALHRRRNQLALERKDANNGSPASAGSRSERGMDAPSC